MTRFYPEYEHDDPAPASDTFAAAITLLGAAMDAKAVRQKVLHLQELQRQIPAAEAKLSRLQSEAAGILEAARAEAERIRKEAADEIEEEKNYLEHRGAQLAYGERYRAKLEAVRRSAPNGILSAYDEHQVRADLAREDAGGTAVNALINRDMGDARSDHLGNVFVPGSTLTRDLSHKGG
jgi:hypothetical protein